MLTVDEARALITTSLSDPDLADIIAREEAWLSRRIGPLEGERVETFVSSDGDEVLRLTRPTLDVALEDDSGEVTFFSLRGWADLIPDGISWRGDVLATYTPSDSLEVRRALVTLVRLTVQETTFAQEAAAGYSVAADSARERAMRYAAWRSLLRPRQPTTTRLRSAIPSGGKSIAAVQTTQE
jgi:hypothetical protein